MNLLPPNFVVSNEYEKVVQLSTTVGSVTLVSGEAGTGKSVLIDYLTVTHEHLNLVKTAPTGVAAINIGGATLHSTFGLPLHIMTPSAIKTHCQQLAMSPASKNRMQSFCRSVQILIIDEISMVRADILDAVDQIMRKFSGRNLPFGGVVVIMVGDLLQLSPIVNEHDLDEFTACGYETPYFFSSNVIQHLLQHNSLSCVQLSTARRQKDEIFLSLLKNIRNSINVDMTTTVINGACFFNKPDEIDRTTVTLCATNAQTSMINQDQLDKLPHAVQTFTAQLVGKFRRDSVLSPDDLQLKVGARVMFTKNHQDGLWVNGTLGTVTGFNNSLPMVLIDDDTQPITVDYVTWENSKYVIQKHANSRDNAGDEIVPIVKEILGSFTQVPLMLAWAITIHKVQGLTFNKVNINLGRGAFAAGQLYVAFSRCRTIDGIILENPIKQTDFITDWRVVKFCNELPYIDCNIVNT